MKTHLVVILTFWSASLQGQELPRILIDTTYRTPSGSTTAVNSGGNLQTAINNAACGDILSLEAGATFTGNFTLPDKDCADGEFVVIRTSTPDGVFPRPGNRVGPSHASLMAKLTAGSGNIIASDSDADHYRFIGLEITPSAAITTLVFLEAGANSANQASHMIFDRCYIHGHATNGARRGISGQGAYISVIDSYLSDFKEVGADTQAFGAWAASGPFKLVNNYFEATSENVLFGGADPGSATYIPSDIEIRRNHFFKPLVWKADDPGYGGVNYDIKNLFELKNARRVLVEGNLFEQNWSDAQAGYAILFTVRNQNDTAPFSTVLDVTFRGNWVRSTGNGIQMLGLDDTYTSEYVERVTLEHNLITDIDTASWGGDGHLVVMNRGPKDYVMEHNTTLPPTTIVLADGTPANTGHAFRYNITQHGNYGYSGAGENCNAVLTSGTFFTSPVVSDNVIQGAAAVSCGSAYPGNDLVVNLSDVGFENLGAEDYRLDALSAYYGDAPGGADKGAWIPAVTAAASQLDWSVDVKNGYTGVAVTFGVPGLPYNQSCDVRVGSAVTTSATGPSRRTVVVTGLTPTSEYFVGIDCGTTWGGWLAWENFVAATNPGGTKTVNFTMRPPATLSTVARVLVECSTSSDMSSPVSAQDTTCDSNAACSVDVGSVPVGLNYCRHTYQTSGDATVAVGGVQVVSVN